MFCSSLSDNRFPTAALVFLHLLLSCIIMGCLGAAVEIFIGYIRMGASHSFRLILSFSVSFLGHVKFAQLTSNLAFSFFLYLVFACALLFLAVTVVQLIGPNAKGTSSLPLHRLLIARFWNSRIKMCLFRHVVAWLFQFEDTRCQMHRTIISPWKWYVDLTE